ncbi:MAG: flagellar hook-associated protein FlgK [Spirochaetota bacterium]|nr:flagellar hook-associated protein FlgK [Spirochaetota bacterium]
MNSSFHGIEVGKRGLVSHQTALNTTGHNLSNVSNPEYSRQKVQLGTTDPLSPPGLGRENSSGQIGSGVSVQKILRVRDSFVDNRIIDEKGYLGYWKQRSFFLGQVEALHNEPNMPSIKSRFEQFINDWNNLGNNSTEGGAREVLRDTSIGLTQHIQNVFDHLWTLRENVDSMLRSKVDEVNLISKQIAGLNNEIQKVQAQGDEPNDLLDKRDALVEKLSSLLDIRVSRSDKDEFIVYVGSQHLIQGDKYEKLRIEENPNNEGFLKIVWDRDNKDLIIKNGEIGGLIETRDVDIKTQLEQLDNFAINLIETVNEIHKDGFGLNFNTQTKFFKQNYLSSNVNGDFDRNGDGNPDSTALYKVNGTQSLKRDDIVGSNGTINLGSKTYNGQDIQINYYKTDTVKDIVDKINKSGADVVAYLNHNGQLTLKATRASDPRLKNFIIRHIEDSGNFLTGFSGLLKQSGASGSFDWNRTGEITKLKGLEDSYSRAPLSHPARWISLDESILREANNIAAAKGIDSDGDRLADKITGENDGSNALRIVASLVSENEYNALDVVSKIDHEPIMMDKYSKSFRSFLDKVIEDLGTYARTANLELKKEESIVHHLLNTKESISGVNIDEEMAAMITYQHGYNASARFVTYLDKMLDTIINRMGA